MKPDLYTPFEFYIECYINLLIHSGPSLCHYEGLMSINRCGTLKNVCLSYIPVVQGDNHD